MDEQAQIEAVEDLRRREGLAKAEFQELAKNLHHLSSTGHIPGVYNSPFVDIKPQAFNEDVEGHLRKVFH
jgi:hypothetical protein